MALDYESTLIEEQLRKMEEPIPPGANSAIGHFLDRFAVNRGREDQRTLIFFPGGMASELVRADESFPAGGYNYRTLWYDACDVILDEAALHLQMAREGGQDLDSEGRFIVPFGAIRNPLLSPYSNFFSWCDANNLDLLEVAWDFRRTADWNVDFFLKHLVPRVRDLAIARGWAAARGEVDDPFKRATLVGHSFGGMLAKWILNEHSEPFCRDLQLAITVGTPFYGYPVQILRLFRSERLLGPLYNIEEITKAISTMPGGYALFFLDSETYDDNRDRLEADPEGFSLGGYPSVDATDPGTRVDPYAFEANRPGNANEGRYPITDTAGAGWTAWFESYQSAGRKEYKRLSARLDDSMRGKFHNMRGVQLDADGAILKNTADKVTWGWYDFSKPKAEQWDVVKVSSSSQGDGVQPAWSARLVTQHEANVHTIPGRIDDDNGTLEHMVLMDHPDVRSRLLRLIRPGGVQNVVERAVRPATMEVFESAVRRVEHIATLAIPLAEKKEALNGFFQGMSRREQEALMTRWFIELARGPVQRPR